MATRVSTPFTTRKPHCGFCASTGFNIPTNHWMIDNRTGKTLCPRLRDTKCKGCGGLGHTPKWCQVWKQGQREQSDARRLQRESDIASGSVWMESISKATAKKPIAEVVVPIRDGVGSRFVALCEDVEDSDHEEDDAMCGGWQWPCEDPQKLQKKLEADCELRAECELPADSEKVKHNVSWSMALRVSSVPERKPKNAIWARLALVKQMREQRLKLANSRWEHNYPTKKAVSKTIWMEHDDDDDGELPDVYSMFKAEEEFRMRRMGMVC
jgi:hypothetical protein